MTRSLSVQLTVTLLAVLAIALLAMGVAIDVSAAKLLQHEFDAALLDDANVLANMVEPKPNNQWEFYEGETPILRGGAVAFVVTLDDGRELARSPKDVVLQQPTRSVQIDRAPRGDELPAAAVANRRIIVRIERSTADIDSLMSRLRLIIFVTGTLVMALSSLLAVVSIRRNLRPLDALVATVHTIDAGRLETRFETAQLPTELMPLVMRLNDLLERLERSFAREKRVSGDLSHELRTPLSGLRALLEVALGAKRNAASYEETLRDCLEIVMQATHMVERMLELVHVEAISGPLGRQPVELRKLVDTSWSALHTAATSRGLRFENRVEAGVRFESEPGLVSLILNNLLSNAVSYTEPNGLIVVESAPQRGVLFSVADSGPRIPAEAVPRLFERLFRADAARTSSAHLGLGLAIVEAAVERIEATVAVEQNDMVRFEVRRKS